jgi:glycosyltransferase involved in cell wall biosynthesis
MKILAFNWQDIKHPLGGGAEVHFHEIFSRLARQGHEVTLFCSSFRGAKKREVIDGIEIIRKGGRNTFNFWVPWAYWRTFRKRGYDVVIDDVNKIPFFTPLYVKEPLVAIFHHFFGKTIFLETHFLAALYVYLSEKLVRFVYPRTPAIVGSSKSTLQELVALGFREEDIVMAPGCVDHALYRPTGILKSQTPLVGSLGRIKKYKSIDHLLRAFALVRKEFPSARLMIVGDGDYRPALEQLARRLNLAEAVIFTGYVSEEEKVQRLQEMHIVVNTSSKEGWGLTVIEANACGTCVIASDVPGLRDSVVDGETGLLYQYGNIDELAEKILLLLRDDELRTRLSKNALEWSNEFRWEDSAKKTMEVLEMVIAARIAPSPPRRGTG